MKSFIKVVFHGDEKDEKIIGHINLSFSRKNDMFLNFD
jgi:hypothetical protein